MTPGHGLHAKRGKGIRVADFLRGAILPDLGAICASVELGPRARRTTPDAEVALLGGLATRDGREVVSVGG